MTSYQGVLVLLAALPTQQRSTKMIIATLEVGLLTAAQSPYFYKKLDTFIVSRACTLRYLGFSSEMRLLTRSSF